MWFRFWINIGIVVIIALVVAGLYFLLNDPVVHKNIMDWGNKGIKDSQLKDFVILIFVFIIFKWFLK
jgi:hypothetical protein